MTRFRKPLPAVMRGEQYSSFAVCLICFLILGLFICSPAWAAASEGQTTQGQTRSSQTTTSTTSPITPYVAAAYSIVGPTTVTSVALKSITLSAGQTDLGVDLTGKNVVVIDQNSKALTLSAVKKGTRVYVCRKDNNVVVVVLPDAAQTGGAKR
jgi:hypothetical protein